MNHPTKGPKSFLNGENGEDAEKQNLSNASESTVPVNAVIQSDPSRATLCPSLLVVKALNVLQNLMKEVEKKARDRESFQGHRTL